MIIHVSPTYPPSKGGLQKVVSDLVKVQIQSGLEAYVITSNRGATSERLSNKHAVVRLKSFGIANTLVMPGLFFRLLRIKRGEIVHLHVSQAFMPEVTCLASMIKGFRFVAQIHYHFGAFSSTRTRRVLHFYEEHVLRLVLKRASRIVVMTDDYKELIHNMYGIPLTKIIVIPNGTDYKPNSEARSLSSSKIRFLTVGRLAVHKDIPFLLDSMQFYAKKISQDFHLYIVGDGDQINILQEHIKKLGLSKLVSLEGGLDDKSLKKRYEQSDIFLFSSMHESFGVVLVEAMAKGLPIVSTNILSVKNVVKNGRNGLLTSRDVSKFAYAIHNLLSDHKLYKSISTNNLNDSRNYTWSEINNRFQDVYKSIA